MIEEQLEAILAEVRALRAAITEVVASTVLASESPQGDYQPSPSQEQPVTGILPNANQPTGTVVPMHPQEASPVPVAQPPHYQAQQPVPTAAPGITKSQLFEKISSVYELLQTVGRGNDVGKVLGEHNAMMIDELDPSHYTTVSQKLDALAEEVNRGT